MAALVLVPGGAEFFVCGRQLTEREIVGPEEGSDGDCRRREIEQQRSRRRANHQDHEEYGNQGGRRQFAGGREPGEETGREKEAARLLAARANLQGRIKRE